MHVFTLHEKKAHTQNLHQIDAKLLKWTGSYTACLIRPYTFYVYILSIFYILGLVSCLLSPLSYSISTFVLPCVTWIRSTPNFWAGTHYAIHIPHIPIFLYRRQVYLKVKLCGYSVVRENVCDPNMSNKSVPILWVCEIKNAFGCSQAAHQLTLDALPDAATQPTPPICCYYNRC